MVSLSPSHTLTLSLLHTHTHSLPMGRVYRIFKTMVSLQMLKEKWPRSLLESVVSAFLTNLHWELLWVTSQSSSHPSLAAFYSTATSQQTFKCTSHQEYVNFIFFFLFKPSEINGWFRSQSGQNLWRQTECFPVLRATHGTTFPSSSECPLSGFQ